MAWPAPIRASSASLHAADEDCELDDEEQWHKANPALGDFRDYEDLATAIRKAKRLPAEEPKVRNLFLNQRVSPSASLISQAEWMACVGEVKIEDGEEVYLGLDLSSVGDLTALVMGSATDPARIVPFFWKPRERLIEHSMPRLRLGQSPLCGMGRRWTSADVARAQHRSGCRCHQASPS